VSVALFAAELAERLATTARLLASDLPSKAAKAGAAAIRLVREYGWTKQNTGPAREPGADAGSLRSRTIGQREYP
jgi:hypothetical protein